jgi:uncharacterized protein
VSEELPVDVLRTHLRQDLRDAMKARRREDVAALRTLIAAIDNAEAGGVIAPTSGQSSTEHVAGATTGAGSSEADRRSISPAELRAILDREIEEIEEHVTRYEKLGKSEDAASLRIQLNVLARYRGLV